MTAHQVTVFAIGPGHGQLVRLHLLGQAVATGSQFHLQGLYLVGQPLLQLRPLSILAASQGLHAHEDARQTLLLRRQRSELVGEPTLGGLSRLQLDAQAGELGELTLLRLLGRQQVRHQTLSLCLMLHDGAQGVRIAATERL